MTKFEETFDIQDRSTWHEDAREAVREGEELAEKHRLAEAVAKFEIAKKIHQEKRGGDSPETAWLFMKLGDLHWQILGSGIQGNQATQALNNAQSNWHWAYVSCLRIFGCMAREQLSLLSRKITYHEWLKEVDLAAKYRQLYLEVEDYNLMERNPSPAAQPAQTTS